MRYVVVSLTFIGTLLIMAVVGFFAIMLFAGPHSDILPRWLNTPVFLLVWALVLVTPVLVARRVWRSLSPKQG